MYIKGIDGYLSEFEGTQVDAAVERVQGLDIELAKKVDTDTTINGVPLDTKEIIITAEDIGALPLDTKYGAKLQLLGNTLHLLSADNVSMSSTNLHLDAARWGEIFGDLENQTDLKDALDSKQPMITSEAMLSSDLVDDTNHTHKFATAEQLAQIATNTQNIATNTQNIAVNTGDISTINGKIPSQASASNQLADKEFVNSSIATNTANFIGTFESVSALEAYTGTVTNNDYAFVINRVVTDNGNDWATVAALNTYDKSLLTNFDYAWVTNGSKFDLYRFDIVAQTWNLRASGINKDSELLNTAYNRYKATVENNVVTWAYEYTLNNSSFTAAQWEAINSGATTTNIGQITTNQNAISLINNTLATYGDIVTHNVSEFATAAQGAKADTALQSIDSTMVVNALGYTPYDDTNPDGFISGIDSTMVVNALGYTPYDDTNPDGFISGITSSDVTTALGYTPYDDTNPDGFISGIDSTMVVDALGYTPYDATNPDGFISSAALVDLTDVAISNVANGQHLVYNSTSQKWENSSVTPLAWGNITGTLANQTDLQNALNGKQPTITGAATTITDTDLTTGRVLVSDSNGKVAISGITTTKLGYLSDVTSSIQTQLNGKYDASNPDGFISGITSSDVTTALGYTPYNSTNPDGFISSAAISTLTDVDLTNLADGEFLKYDSASGKWINTASGGGSSTLSGLTDVDITSPTQGQNLTYDAVNNKWINATSSATVGWGGITGNINDQTDLKNALDSKASVTFRDWSVS